MEKEKICPLVALKRISQRISFSRQLMGALHLSRLFYLSMVCFYLKCCFDFLVFFFGATDSCLQCHIFLDSTHFISSCHQINHGLVLFFYFLSLFPNFFIFYFSSYFGMFLLQLIFSALAVVLIASKDSLLIEMSLSIIYKDIFPHT